MRRTKAMRSRGLGLAKKLIFKLVVAASSPISPRAAMMATYMAKSAEHEHRPAGDGAARPWLALMMDETHAHAPLTGFLHGERATARMDLRKARIDQGLNALHIEAIRHG